MRESSVKNVVGKVLLMAALLLSLLLLHIWVRMQFVTESFKLSSLRSELESLESRRAQKQIARDELFSPKNLDLINESSKFQLRLPSTKQLVEWDQRIVEP